VSRPWSGLGSNILVKGAGRALVSITASDHDLFERGRFFLGVHVSTDNGVSTRILNGAINSEPKRYKSVSL